MSMSAGITLFKNRASQPDTHEFGLSKTQVDYCLLRRNQWKLLKDRKVLPIEESITQHKPFVCDFKIREVKDTRRKIVPRGKIWKLHEDSLMRDLKSYINRYRASNQKDASVEGYWEVLKGVSGKKCWYMFFCAPQYIFACTIVRL